mmetsp:Transcript_37495/g.107621  ORF Transcript_37495/g.107621 Transcript_37495/m.107621 type:complete len:281 (-) Transcript_37495:167-1009(-)
MAMYFNASGHYNSWSSWGSGDATRTAWASSSSHGRGGGWGSDIWAGSSNLDMWGVKPGQDVWGSKPGAGYNDWDDESGDYSSASSSAGWRCMSEEPGTICVVNSLTSGACASLCGEAETADVIGFDAEWVPDYSVASNNPISVLQLAFPESGRVYVVQLGALSGQLPQAVQLMLLNPEVTKVGFGCSYKDASKFEKSGIVVTRGSMVDVQTRCAALLGANQMVGLSLSLKRAALDLLGFVLEKEKKHTCSDWSAEKLSPEQVRYAALDAWVALRLYYRTS